MTGTTDESFLPQILGIFFAVFDPQAGPIVTHQVPENLISTGTGDAHQPASLSGSLVLPPPEVGPIGTPAFSNALLPDSAVSPHTRQPGLPVRRSSGSGSTTTRSRSRSHRGSPVQPLPARMYDGWTPGSSYASPLPLPLQLDDPAADPLIDFSTVSEYVIPRECLTHRLVTCTTDRHKVLGFPCAVRAASYQRNEYRWNLCFVFNRRGGRTVEAGWARGRRRSWEDDDGYGRDEGEQSRGEVDLSAFESVVRKCGRILRGCEVESQLLSSPSTNWKLHSIIEQIFEDLNSYSETSIQIDQVNNLELKLFPFFPNPSEVQGWHVPIALVELDKIKDANWDLCVLRIIPHINGLHHVAKIAQLADADMDLTRLCIQHLLFYQVIMMQDLFQFSNMYTIKPVLQQIIQEKSVGAECGPYVTRKGFQPVPRPFLLELYSRLVPGRTVMDWALDNSVLDLGIDIRRFVSFGLIKGFLRRVHRWPILDRTMSTKAAETGVDLPVLDVPQDSDSTGAIRRGLLRHGSDMTVTSGAPSTSYQGSMWSRQRDGNTANESAITLRSMGSNEGSFGSTMVANGSKGKSVSPGDAMSRMTGWGNGLRLTTSKDLVGSPPMSGAPARSGTAGGGLSTSFATSGRQSSTGTVGGSGTGLTTARQARAQRNSARSIGASSSGLTIPGTSGASKRTNPEVYQKFLSGLERLLDGDHHTDELQVQLGVSWARLEGYLMEIGGIGSLALTAEGKRERVFTEEEVRRMAKGDYGRIKIVLR